MESSRHLSMLLLCWALLCQHISHCQWQTMWTDDMVSSANWQYSQWVYFDYDRYIQYCFTGTCAFAYGGYDVDQWMSRSTDISSGYKSLRFTVSITAELLESGNACLVSYQYDDGAKVVIGSYEILDGGRFTSYPSQVFSLPSPEGYSTLILTVEADGDEDALELDGCYFDDLILEGIPGTLAPSMPSVSPTPSPSASPSTSYPSTSPSTAEPSESPSTSNPSTSPTFTPTRRTKQPSNAPTETQTTNTEMSTDYISTTLLSTNNDDTYLAGGDGAAGLLTGTVAIIIIVCIVLCICAMCAGAYMFVRSTFRSQKPKAAVVQPGSPSAVSPYDTNATTDTVGPTVGGSFDVPGGEPPIPPSYTMQSEGNGAIGMVPLANNVFPKVVEESEQYDAQDIELPEEPSQVQDADGQEQAAAFAN